MRGNWKTRKKPIRTRGEQAITWAQGRAWSTGDVRYQCYPLHQLSSTFKFCNTLKTCLSLFRLSLYVLKLKGMKCTVNSSVKDNCDSKIYKFLERPWTQLDSFTSVKKKKTLSVNRTLHANLPHSWQKREPYRAGSKYCIRSHPCGLLSSRILLPYAPNIIFCVHFIQSGKCGP